jgi:type I restriction-modification system DNA methylase subunit
MSLFLKLLEGESAETFGKQLSFELKETILPNLSNNIKCGNSLVGMDILDINKDLFGEKYDLQKIRPFDWQTAFPEVMRNGGFDVIVGNPPYVRPHNIEVYAKEYYWKHYESFVKKSDLYCCFIQKALELAREGGFISYIVSDGWLRLDSFEKIRDLVLRYSQVLKLVQLPEKVFEDATVKTGIFVFKKNGNVGQRQRNIIEIQKLNEQSMTYESIRTIPQVFFENTFKKIFDTSLSPEVHQFKAKIEQDTMPLGKLLDIRFGLKTGDDEMFISKKKSTSKHKALLRGENIQRYAYEFEGEYVWYVPEKMRDHKQTARPGESERFEQPKILIKDTSTRLGGTLDVENYYVKDVLILTKIDTIGLTLQFILGILNSSVIRFYYESTFPTLHVQNEELSSLPIRTIDFNNPDEKATHDRMLQLVERMLDLHKKKQHANSDSEKELFEHQIKATDKEIDELVYKLYRLTEEEIKIVERK